MGIIAWIVLGLGAGLLANMLIPGRRSQGLIITCVIGIAGALLGPPAAVAAVGGDHDGGRTSETAPGSRQQTSALQEHNEQVIHDFDVPDAWSAAIEQQAP